MFRSLLSAASSLCLFCQTAEAATVNIPALRDTTLYESAEGTLANGLGAYLFTGATNSAGLRRSLLAFDVSAVIPAGAFIVSAELRLFQSRTRAGNESLSLHKMTRAWVEGTTIDTSTGGSGAALIGSDATWRHASAPASLWTAPGAQGDYLTSASSTSMVSGSVGTFTWTGLAPDVATWLATPGSNHGWILIGNENGLGNASRFNSAQFSDSTLRPALFVEFIPVPEPGSACALAAAAVLLHIRRRR